MQTLAHLSASVLLLGLAGPSSLLVAGDRNEAVDGAQRHATLRGSAGDLGDLSMASLVQTRAKTRRLMSRDPEMLEPWQDSHSAVYADPTALMQTDQGLDAKAYGDELHSLVDSYQSRFVGTEGNMGVASQIADKFRKLGLEVTVEDLDQTAAVGKYLNRSSAQKLGPNVIGKLTGTDLKHETVIVGAHYDSVNWEKTGGKAPGVDDNGSGSALVQLVARAMATHKAKPRRTMMFVGFNAEEETLVGSNQMARKAHRGDYGDVKGVLIADEVAYPGSGSGERKAIFETVGTVPGTNTLVDTLAKHAQAHAGDGINGFEVNKHGFGSDHMSFLQLGIPSALLIERDNMAHADAYGHSERDNWDHVDMGYGAAMTRLMLRAASALGSPQHEMQSAEDLTMHPVETRSFSRSVSSHM